MKIKKQFKSIAIRLMQFNDKNLRIYRMFKDDKEFVDIKADTVYEAIKKSEIKTPRVIKVLINRLEGIIKNHEKLASDGGIYETKIEPENNQAEESRATTEIVIPAISPEQIQQEIAQATAATKAAVTATTSPNKQPQVSPTPSQ